MGEHEAYDLHTSTYVDTYMPRAKLINVINHSSRGVGGGAPIRRMMCKYTKVMALSNVINHKRRGVGRAAGA